MMMRVGMMMTFWHGSPSSDKRSRSSRPRVDARSVSYLTIFIKCSKEHKQGYCFTKPLHDWVMSVEHRNILLLFLVADWKLFVLQLYLFFVLLIKLRYDWDIFPLYILLWWFLFISTGTEKEEDDKEINSCFVMFFGHLLGWEWGLLDFRSFLLYFQIQIIIL